MIVPSYAFLSCLSPSGILAVDIGIDKESLICRAAYDKDPEYFSKQVDYMIQPTIANNATSEEHQ